MGEVEDRSAAHPRVVPGGLHPVRRVLMAAEVLVGAVEIGIKDFAERLPVPHLDPLGATVHDERRADELRRKFRRGLDVVRQVGAGAGEFRSDVEEKLVAVGSHAAGAGEDQSAPLREEFAELSGERFSDPHLIRQDQP